MEPTLYASRLGDARHGAAGIGAERTGALVAGLLRYAGRPRTGAEIAGWLEERLGAPMDPAAQRILRGSTPRCGTRPPEGPDRSRPGPRTSRRPRGLRRRIPRPLPGCGP
ncbi:hypothetical protein [Streptomyces chryseus]|uniref:hypothetical protein n=1 Tax=Streptomyces chryseus TaxID=68186 RepID=UPI001E587C73|nr:hypothetical protein [Streptomyces chryseus]